MTRIDNSVLKLDRDELIARMMCTDIDTVLSLSAECEDEIRTVAECSYTFKKSLVAINSDVVTLDFGNIKSMGLAKVLEGCNSAYVVAVTLGHGVDRLLRQKSVTSTSQQFFADAVASTLCESLCDHVQGILPHKTTRRFSPGYGDLSLDVQYPLLRFLNGCDIRLTESGLMVPSKSVTFIAGVKE
ncbi:MAG: hypothetical protein J6Q76_07520 [Clostridia bacterium]|nr:hypothetical protein [Clostridia bacterium]